MASAYDIFEIYFPWCKKYVKQKTVQVSAIRLGEGILQQKQQITTRKWTCQVSKGTSLKGTYPPGN